MPPTHPMPRSVLVMDVDVDVGCRPIGGGSPLSVQRR